MTMEKLMSHGLAGIAQTDLTPHLGLHVYLCCFMTGVGVLKFGGFLPHKNSRLVGFLELFAGLILLPGWPQISSLSSKQGIQLETYNLYLMGASMILTALGIVTGDKKKRYSVVCWFHAVLILGFCVGLSLDNITLLNQKVDPVLAISLFFIYGHIVGKTFGEEVKAKQKKSE